MMVFSRLIRKRAKLLSVPKSLTLCPKGFSSTCNLQIKGVVVGAYQSESDTSNGSKNMTAATSYLINGSQKNRRVLLTEHWQDFAPKKGKVRYFPDVDHILAVVGLGEQNTKEKHQCREAVREAVAAGVRALQDLEVDSIEVDPCDDSEAAAEGAHLALFAYDELKDSKKRKKVPSLSLFSHASANYESKWERGLILAEGQNLARRLMEMPGNLLTPMAFGDIAVEELAQYEEASVILRDYDWARDCGMDAFLGVAKGSDQAPVFVEISYRGAAKTQDTFALVGKGITFDSGGISIKPSSKMEEMRADMGGAACVLATIVTLARLKVPINVMGFIPLCENMPSSTALKPGDVVRAMNGKTIQVDNTDAEGRLILADALCYAETFNPTGIIDMATLTGAIRVALGSGAAAAFTNSETMWQQLHQAGEITGDRVWRMPLWEHYTKQITKSELADLNNIGGGREGGACTAAAFLKEFVTNPNWCHLDIAGVMKNKSEIPYLGKGMSGRPTRTIVEFLCQQASS